MVIRQPILVCADDEDLLGPLPELLRLDGYQPHTAEPPGTWPGIVH